MSKLYRPKHRVGYDGFIFEPEEVYNLDEEVLSAVGEESFEVVEGDESKAANPIDSTGVRTAGKKQVKKAPENKKIEEPEENK